MPGNNVFTLIITLLLAALAPLSCAADSAPVPAAVTLSPMQAADTELQPGLAAFEAGDRAKAIALLKPFADQKNPLAMYYVGLMYLSPGSTPQDAVRAYSLFRELADQNSIPAEVLLGYMYLTGVGVTYDYNSYLKWMNLAFQQDASVASSVLDTATFGGRTTPEAAFALFMYQQAGHQKDPSALYSKSLALASDSAAKGDAMGEDILGTMYNDGRAVVKDQMKAVSLYKLSANQGFSWAENDLGTMYFNGNGILRDYDEARRYYLLAAKQGVMVAEDNLCRMFTLGNGVPVDYVDAYMWCNLAAAQGDDDAAKRLDALQGRMTSGQVEKAQKKSREFLSAISYKPAVDVPAEGVTKARHSLTSVENPPTGRGLKLHSTGTGFYVNVHGDLITNAHVIDGCGEVRASNGNTTALLTLQAEDAADDLALLTHSGPVSAAAEFRDGTAVQVGEHVVVFGFPLPDVLSGQLTLTDGSVSALGGLGGAVQQFQFSAPIQPGNSGGPILDASGRLVGMSEAKLNAVVVSRVIGDVPQNVNFAINETTLRAFLDLHAVTYNLARTTSAVEEPTLAKQASGYTVLLQCWK